MLTIIFRIILALVHAGYRVFDNLKSRLTLIRLIFFSSNIWRPTEWGKSVRQSSRIMRENQEIRALKLNVGRMKNLPVHLCIVVAERVSFRHLARILGWCIAVGIPYVSFYDHNGFLKKKQNDLRIECERTMPQLAALIDWESRSIKNLERDNNRADYQRRTIVQMFSNDDGKGEIVTLAKNLSRAVTHGVVKMEEIDTELLNNKLRLDNTPDPDVAIVCGPALSTYGLLPWHTRTTEFFNLRSHREASINDFIFLLEKYSLCEQRHGK